ncbi:hypothetical protein HUG17_8774 [Dermatophagoides farinae]|uniref:Uncharacterized protein n=1 Tax=Dermatophagoides farinae TaxID=6954 RepID=A0A9D4NTV3_DERFA|nr:uncharacterized protein LOC124497198 [Dermatophagoides farinae]KAH7637670.1 hypothetical protein HUG17_8774 [Dermatophagoides farinae]
MDDSKHSDEIDDQSMNAIQLMAMNHSEIQRWIIENYSNKSISSRNKLYERMVQTRQSYIDSMMKSHPFQCSNLSPIKCRLPRLNKFFQSIRPSSIICITGDSNTGKSMLATSIAIDCVSISKRKVLFIDSDLSLTNDRLRLLHSNLDDLNSLIQIYPIFEINQLYNLFEMIDQDEQLHRSVLIIDSFNCFIWASKHSNCSRESFITRLLYAIESITRKCYLTTIITRLNNRFDHSLHLDIDITLKNGYDDDDHIIAEIITKNTWPRSKFDIEFHIDKDLCHPEW